MVSCLINLPVFLVYTKLILTSQYKKKRRYLSNRCLRVEFIALSTVAIASTIDVCTKGSPFRLTLGTREKGIHMLLQKWPHAKRYFHKTESRHDIISVLQSKLLFFKC